MEVLLAVALQGALIGILIMGTERLPRGEWNDKPLSLLQAKALQGFLALCIVFHHCAEGLLRPLEDGLQSHWL